MLSAMGLRHLTLVRAGKRRDEYVQKAIATAPGLGSGNGPLNHLAEEN